MEQFRFMDLEIWHEAVDINDTMYDLADKMIEDKSFRMAEQLRGASLSISNNIAEGSGSFSNKDFANFLNYSHRSVFEVANIICIAQRRDYISDEILIELLDKLDKLGRKITNFRKAIIK